MIVLGGGAFARCLSHEGRALMNGVSVLIKEAPERSLTLLPWKGTVEKHELGAKERVLTGELNPAGILLLDFPVSKNCEK